MEHQIRLSIVSVCASVLIGYSHFAMADITSDTEKILNWAEKEFPQYFPEHQTTQNLDPWRYRFYPQTGIYAGINTADQNAYVLGGPFGNNDPVFIDTTAGLTAAITGSGGNGDIPACNTANIPDGFVYRQSGNVIEITTNGQCIKLPRDTNLCQPLEQPGDPVPTGISVLTKTEVLAAEWRGIQSSSFPPSYFGAQPGSSAICILNAPAEEHTDLIIHSDICWDMTEEMQAQLATIPDVTVTPPIGQATKMTITSTQVADCFQTNADTIYDAYTDEILKSPAPQIPDINIPGL